MMESRTWYLMETAMMKKSRPMEIATAATICTKCSISRAIGVFSFPTPEAREAIRPMIVRSPVLITMPVVVPEDRKTPNQQCICRILALLVLFSRNCVRMFEGERLLVGIGVRGDPSQTLKHVRTCPNVHSYSKGNNIGITLLYAYFCISYGHSFFFAFSGNAWFLPPSLPYVIKIKKMWVLSVFLSHFQL